MSPISLATSGVSFMMGLPRLVIEVEGPQRSTIPMELLTATRPQFW